MVSEFNILFGKEGMTVNVSEVSLKWGSSWKVEEGESFPLTVPVCLLPKFWHSCSLCSAHLDIQHEAEAQNTSKEQPGLFHSLSGTEIHS